MTRDIIVEIFLIKGIAVQLQHEGKLFMHKQARTTRADRGGHTADDGRTAHVPIATLFVLENCLLGNERM